MVNLIHSVNFGSLTAATAASFIVSAIWYGPLFGEYWLEYSHLNRKKLEDYKNEHKHEKGFLAVLCSFLVALVISNLQDLLDVKSYCDAAWLAFAIWLGYIFTTLVGNFLWDITKKQVLFVNLAHQLVNLTVQALIIYFIEDRLPALKLF